MSKLVYYVTISWSLPADNVSQNVLAHVETQPTISYLFRQRDKTESASSHANNPHHPPDHPR